MLESVLDSGLCVVQGFLVEEGDSVAVVTSLEVVSVLVPEEVEVVLVQEDEVVVG